MNLGLLIRTKALPYQIIVYNIFDYIYITPKLLLDINFFFQNDKWRKIFCFQHIDFTFFNTIKFPIIPGVKSIKIKLRSVPKIVPYNQLDLICINCKIDGLLSMGIDNLTVSGGNNITEIPLNYKGKRLEIKTYNVVRSIPENIKVDRLLIDAHNSIVKIPDNYIGTELFIDEYNRISKYQII